jgi:glycine cleavage system H protein
MTGRVNSINALNLFLIYGGKMNTPGNLKYTKTDEWVLIDGNIATIGVTDYAQDQLSDVVFVEITVSDGDNLKKQSHIATIESVKAAADVNIPISGKVTEINEALANTPEDVNADPFGKAWMVKVEMTDPSEVNQLLDAKTYEDFCSTRSH